MGCKKNKPKKTMVLAVMRFYLRVLADLNEIVRRRKRDVILRIAITLIFHEIFRAKEVPKQY
jgi:hypothetical protein